MRLHTNLSKQNTGNQLIYMRRFVRDLVPFVQFKKREKHPLMSVIFSKVAGSSLHMITDQWE